MTDTADSVAALEASTSEVDKSLELVREWYSKGSASDVLADEVERLRAEQKLDGAEIEKLQRELTELRDGLSMTSTQEQNAACDAQHFEREVERLSADLKQANADRDRLRRELARENSECRELTRNLFESRDLAVRERDAAYDENSKLRDELALVTDQEARTAKLCAETQEALEKFSAENAELREANAAFAEADRRLNDELGWFRNRKVLSEELQSIYAALTESKHDAIVEATAKLFDFDVNKPGAGE